MFKMLNVAAVAVALSLVLGSSVQAATKQVAKECTQYVIEKNSLYKVFERNGHAKDWYSRALSWGFRHRGQNDKPEAGDVIVVAASGTGAQRYGHVMLIRSIKSFTDIKNFTAVVGHANYPAGTEKEEGVVVKNGSFNNTPVLGVITPRDVGFSAVDGTNAALTFEKGQSSQFEVTLRYVGKKAGSTKGLSVKPADPGTSASKNFAAVSSYKFHEKVKGEWLSYDGELKQGRDYKFTFWATASWGTYNGKGVLSAVKPQWCLNNGKGEKLGCFQFQEVYVK